jgi:uncharacterized protein
MSRAVSVTSSLRLAAGYALMLVTATFAFEKDKPPTPPVIPPNTNNLPLVLLIGDSISAGYRGGVAKALEGKAIVTKSSDNGESTAVGVIKIDGWLGDTKWAVIHFNWGVWDMYGWQYASDDRSPAAYAQRLEALVVRMKKTGAKLIWATTTPVPPKAEGTMLKRWKKEVVITPELENQYREAALNVMKKYDVQINDLYALLKPRQSEFQAEDNVHFSGGGSALMAQQVADAILKSLGTEAGKAVQPAPAVAPEAPAPSSGRFIDAHVHFHACKTGELDKVIVWMNSNNVQRVINYPLAQSRPKNDAERKQMLENYAKHKDRIGRGCVIFPYEVNSVEEAVAILTREKQEGAVVLGEHYGEGLKFDDPKNLRLYEACAKVGLPIMFHYSDRTRNMDEKGMPRLENVLKLYPNCTIIAHGDWWRSLPEGSCGRLLQAYPNFYADISCTVGRAGIRRDMERSREFFIKHADKLLFGTDSGWWSFGKPPTGEFALMDELKLPKDVEEKISRKNAERLFGWTK